MDKRPLSARKERCPGEKRARPSMPHDVFISHSKDDKLTALALCNKLESKGVRCWIAPRDVAPGVEWGAAIIEAITGSRLMVLIFSLKANSSPHVHREVQRAFAKNLTVIPVRVEHAKPTGTLEYYLGSVHWLDAMTPPIEKHLETVAKQVKALLPALVKESASRLAAEGPPTAPKTTNRPIDIQRRAQFKASDAQTELPGNLPPSSSPVPRSPRPSSPTDRSPILWEQIVRNIGAFISSGHPVQGKGILVSVVLLAVLNVIVAGMLRAVSSGAPALLAYVFLMGLVLFQMGIFFRIGWGATEKRWSHLLAVAIGAWLILSCVYAISDLGGFREWGLLVLGICLSMGSGGAFSILAKSSHEKKLSLVSMVASGVGLLFIVYVVLVIAFAVTRTENVRRLEDPPIERHGRPPR